MAKLEGVRLYEVVGGEVTKVKYDGDTYVKVEANAKEGDLVQSKESGLDVTAGAFYEVTKVFGTGDVVIYDDVDDRHERESHTIEVFRSIDGGFREVDREAEVGDYIRFTDEELPDWIRGDKHYEVIRIDPWGDPHIIDEEGDSYDLSGDRYDVFEKIEGGSEEYFAYHNGKKLRKVDRKAKKGDYVRYKTSPDSDTPSDKFFEVIDVKGRYIDEGGRKLWVDGWDGHDRYETFEVVSEDSLVGKYVEVISGDDDKEFDHQKGYAGWGRNGQGLIAFGSIGRVTEETGEGVYVDFEGEVRDITGDIAEEDFYLRNGEFEVVDAFEAKQGGKTEDALSVGDYVKVVGITHFADIDEGTIAKIGANKDDDGEYIIELLDGTDFDYAKPESLEKVEISDREMTFVKAGREINHNKVGDIVRVTKGYEEIKRGDIGVVTKDDIDGIPKVRVGDYEYYVAEVELVAPVETRVDIDA